MSSLKYVDRIKLERFFDMKSGYVCDFSDRTFGDFVFEQTNIDPYADGYDQEGTSKANRLRCFWKRESNYLVAQLTKEMLEYWKTQKENSVDGLNIQETNLYKVCLEIVERLLRENHIENVEVFSIKHDNTTTQFLAQSIKDSIEKDKPQEAMDRLHTYVIQLFRELSDKHLIPYDKDIPLHSLFGGYIKFIKEKGFLESDMSEKILKSPIALLKAFNDVRNDQSLAHANEILNYDECVLIFNNITNTLKFIEAVEKNLAKKIQKESLQEKEKINISIPWEDMEYSEEDPELFEKIIDARIEEGRRILGI